jgi:hypothetical protein
MLPTQGQGASQAIEDSEALGAFFEDVTENPSIEEITSIFTVCLSPYVTFEDLKLTTNRTYSRVDMLVQVSYKRTAGKLLNRVQRRGRKM